MAITINGTGSSFPIDTWISQLVQVKQDEIDAISSKQSTATSRNSALSTVKTSYSSLLSALQTITDSKFGGTKDIFANTTASSSDTTVVTATSTSAAAKQNLKIIVSRLATNTVAQTPSDVQAAGYMDSDTKFSSLANGAAKAGSLSFYVDGTKNNITITSDDTIGTILDKIKATDTSVTATVSNDGKINIASSSGKSIVIGSSSDTSNFADVTSLQKNSTTGAYASSKSIYEVNSSAKLTSSDAGFKTAIKEGSFKIGDDTFKIDSTTTLDGLLSQINSSTKANVSAYWDSNSGKLVISSKEEGAYNINIENISGNFTDVVGLTTSTYDTNGKVTSTSLTEGSQKLGDSALLSINGTEITSSSNTVTSDISGITGLTLTLKGESKSDTTSTTVNVTADNTSTTSSINSFVSAFNSVLTNTDAVTSTDGYLYGETSLNLIRNNIRKLATASVSSSSVYKSLADIGITTGAIGTSVTANTNQLVVDSTKLSKALSEHPEEVKKLLIGDGTNDGVLTKISTVVDDSLDSVTGFFAAKSKSLTKEISGYQDNIDKQTTALADYKTALTAKFSAMDTLISNLNQQLATFKSTLGIT